MLKDLNSDMQLAENMLPGALKLLVGSENVPKCST